MKLSERPGLLGPLHHTTIYTIINPELLNPELQNQVDYRYLNIVMGKETSRAAWYARPVTPGRRPVKKRMFHIIPNRSPNLQRGETTNIYIITRLQPAAFLLLFLVSTLCTNPKSGTQRY